TFQRHARRLRPRRYSEARRGVCGPVSRRTSRAAHGAHEVCQGWHSGRRSRRVCLTTWRTTDSTDDAGWSSLAAREAHNLEVGGSNPPPAILIRSREARGRGVLRRAAHHAMAASSHLIAPPETHGSDPGPRSGPMIARRPRSYVT